MKVQGPLTVLESSTFCGLMLQCCWESMDLARLEPKVAAMEAQPIGQVLTS